MRLCLQITVLLLPQAIIRQLPINPVLSCFRRCMYSELIWIPEWNYHTLRIAVLNAYILEGARRLKSMQEYDNAGWRMRRSRQW